MPCTDKNSRIFVVRSLSLLGVFHNRSSLAVTTHKVEVCIVHTCIPSWINRDECIILSPF